MTDEHQQREPVPKPAQSWDYSSDPFKAGGMQIIGVVVGFGVTLLLMVLFGVVWYFLA